jgi:choline dehydrogenase-like flavoprotein
VTPIEHEYQNLASGVGSGTVVYGGQAWRFHPDDFRMASRYGIPDGSSLTDWPFGYDELGPWYERAEWEIGVAGSAGSDPNEGWRRRAYPMPPFPTYAAARVLREGAATMGIRTFSPPLLINSIPHDGRLACIECGSCVGFPCPTDAKNGTQNTVIPRALATGRCDLMTSAMVARIKTDDRGMVIGVDFIGSDKRPGTIRATAVVVAAGAIETARLLLMSASAFEPNGLGNANDLVGRNLQGHYYPSVYGLFKEDVQLSRGPGVTIATTDFSHGNEGVIGGALLADDFVISPIALWHLGFPPDLPRWGIEAKNFMREHYRHVMLVKGPVHEIPNPECRITLAPTVRDRHGLAVARLSGVAHIETVRTARYIQRKARAWVEAAGAVKTWSREIQQVLSAHSHQAGTCRMGADPKRSVTDTFGRVWGHANLFVADGSLHPTNGAYNPALTIMALAFRNAEHIGQSVSFAH